MSYYKVKSIKIDMQSNKILMTATCNNVRPLMYYETEYWKTDSDEGISINQKLIAMFKSIYLGNLQLNSTVTKRIRELTSGMQDWINFIDRTSQASQIDSMYKTNLFDKLVEGISSETVRLYLNKEEISEADMDCFTSSFCEEAKEVYSLKLAEYKREDKLPIRSARNSDLFPGYIVVEDYTNSIYVVKKEDYENLGVLSNASNYCSVKAGIFHYEIFHALAGDYKEKTETDFNAYSGTHGIMYQIFPAIKAILDNVSDKVFPINVSWYKATV